MLFHSRLSELYHISPRWRENLHTRYRAFACMAAMPINPLGTLHVTFDAKESAQCADDQRNHDRGSATAIDSRTNRDRDLRRDDADYATNRHRPAKHRDDHAPVHVPCIMKIDEREPREQRQQAGQIEQDARAQRLRDHSFIDAEIDQHAERDGDECRPYQSGEKR
jgi:hypothetical protein